MGNINTDCCGCGNDHALDDEYEMEKTTFDNSSHFHDDEDYFQYVYNDNIAVANGMTTNARRQPSQSMDELFDCLISGFVRHSLNIEIQIHLNILRLIAMHIPGRLVLYNHSANLVDVLQNVSSSTDTSSESESELQSQPSSVVDYSPYSKNSRSRSRSRRKYIATKRRIVVDFDYIARNCMHFWQIFGESNINAGMLNLFNLGSIFHTYTHITVHSESNAYKYLVNMDWWLLLLSELKLLDKQIAKQKKRKKQIHNIMKLRSILFYFSIPSKDQETYIFETFDLYHRAKFTAIQAKVSFSTFQSQFCVCVLRDESDPLSILYENNMIDILANLSRFLRTVPPVSKEHIWKHSVKKARKSKGFLKITQSEQHIQNLMCDVLIVYVKYSDRSKRALKVKEIRPFVIGISRFIYNHNEALVMNSFINEQGYFARMIEEYVEDKNQDSVSESEWAV